MIKYFPRFRNKPGDPAPEHGMYYATIVPITPLGIDEICANITEVSTITRADVKAVLSALQSEVAKAVANGMSVRLGDLGSFRPTLVSSGSDAIEDVKATNVVRVRCRFTPGSLISRRISLKNTGEVKFQLVQIPVQQSGSEHI